MSKTPEELIPALRQYLHNDGSDFVAGYDIAEVNRIFAALKEENDRLKNSESINEALLKQQNERLKAREAELEAALKGSSAALVALACCGVIDEKSRVTFDSGEKKTIGEILDAANLALEEPANEG